jgi:hypothetical protein
VGQLVSVLQVLLQVLQWQVPWVPRQLVLVEQQRVLDFRFHPRYNDALLGVIHSVPTDSPTQVVPAPQEAQQWLRERPRHWLASDIL